jgi:hypothetical protein
MNRKIHIVTESRLRRAVRTVRRELVDLGFWDDAVADIDVYLVRVGFAYGWQWHGDGGDIEIPRYSASRLIDRMGFGHTAYLPRLMDLRHENGHATHRHLVETRRFEKAFWAPYNDDTAVEFDAEIYVTEYATSNCHEDFAETFAEYLKRGGRLPVKFDTSTIRAKWAFVRWMATRIGGR